jgi:cyclin E
MNHFVFFPKVCEVYHLHRETYHLSIAYIDQYLSNTKNLAKNKFQLLGITSLFVAAKIEV